MDKHLVDADAEERHDVGASTPKGAQLLNPESLFSRAVIPVHPCPSAVSIGIVPTYRRAKPSITAGLSAGRKWRMVVPVSPSIWTGLKPPSAFRFNVI